MLMKLFPEFLLTQHRNLLKSPEQFSSLKTIFLCLATEKKFHFNFAVDEKDTQGTEEI